MVKIKLEDIKQKSPTLDFNKRPNMQSLNKRYCKHLTKIYALKGLGKTNLAAFL